MKFRIIESEILTSTNDVASQMCEKGELAHGDVIFTLNQYSGRGQGDNSWESEPGKNIAATIYLKPINIHASNQVVLTQIISLAIADLLTYVTKREDVKIKWPNDIYIGKAKVAGILIQNYIYGNKIDGVIAGIGINVNQSKFLSDAPNPISLKQIAGVNFDVNDVLEKLLEKIDYYYIGSPDENQMLALEDEYLKRLYQINVKKKYLADGKIFEGTITGIDEYGRLKIIDEQGIEHIFAHKEVAFC